MSSSPRPIAHRAFTVLLAVLLVGGVVAPIGAAEPAAAQDGDTVKGAACYSVSSVAGPGGYLINEACQDWAIDETSYDGDAAATQTTMHGMAVSEWESQQAIQTILQNYGEDTESIASLEAKNGIATGYEQGNTSAVADEMARERIKDYYALRQVNTLESFSKQQAQLAHIGNLTNEDAIEDRFIYQPASLNKNEWSMTENYYTGELHNRTYTLVNGTSYEYQAAGIHLRGEYDMSSSSHSFSYVNDLEDFSVSQDGRSGIPSDSVVSGTKEYPSWEVSHSANVMSSYSGTDNNVENGLPGQRIYSLDMWLETMSMWETQSANMTTEYVDMAGPLYDEMDVENLDPNELRGAEGMVRYLSGDGNATSGDYRTALHYTLDTSNPNLTETSTMRVQIDGFTGLTWNESTDSTSRDPIPTDPMNSTVEGLLFADGVESVESGETFQTNATDDQSFYVIADNGTQTTLIEGNMTIKAIYDADGNEKESAGYDDPEYGSYNASEFVNYLQDNENARAAILGEDDESGGDSGGLLENWPPDPGVAAGGAFVGLVIVVGAFGVVAAVVFRRP